MRSAHVLVTALVLAGCGGDGGSEVQGPDLSQEESPSLGDGKADTASGGGTLTNTSMFNGRTGNGRTGNGRTGNGRTGNGRTGNGPDYAMTGVDLSTMSMAPAPAVNSYPSLTGGTKLAGVHLLPGGVLTNAGTGPLIRLGARTGVDFKNALVTTTMTDGSQATLWIKDVYRDPADTTRMLYTVLAYHKDPALVDDPTSECARTGQNCNWQWDYACGNTTSPAGKIIPTPALAIPGQWSFQSGVPGGGAKTVHIADGGSTRITFGCTNGAIGKCARWGYDSWKTVNGVSLEPYHETCTRMVRLDYCGDGTSLTSTGVQINVYDRLGILTDDADWPFESTWNTGGGKCGSGTRQVCIAGATDQYGHTVCKDHSTQQVVEYIQKYCPNDFVPTSGPSLCVNKAPLITTEYKP